MENLDLLVSDVGDVTFAQLRTFALVAKVGSFAKAADLLAVSQPTVSEQIKTLEQRLGFLLFHRRSGTTPTLTARGEDAVAVAESILTAGRSLVGNRQEAVKKTCLRLSVGTYLRDQFIRPLLPQIYHQMRNLQIDLQPLVPSNEALRSIDNGSLDLALIAIPAESEVPQNARLVCDIPMVIIAPPGTKARLARGECSLADFQHFFSVPSHFGGDMVGRVFRSLDIGMNTPHLFIEFVDSLIEMVENREGLGHVMSYAVTDKIASGALESLDVDLWPTKRVIARSPHAPPEALLVEKMITDALPT